METRENRIGWIDTIKAICMFAVMINHQPLAHDGLRVDYFFLVGFFFCSGLTYRVGRSLKYRLVRVADSLVIPYFLLSAVTFFLYLKNVRGLVGGDMSVVAGWWQNVLLGHAMWFIPCLISVEILYALAKKLKAENCLVWGGYSYLFLGRWTECRCLGMLTRLSMPYFSSTWGMCFKIT